MQPKLKRSFLTECTFALSLSLAVLPALSQAQQNPTGLALPNTAQVQDVFTPLPPDEIRLTGGMLGTRIDRSEKNRLLNVNEDDLLDCFERRNAPHQDWQGEHVGKFLHAATLAWQNTGDAALKTKLDRVVARLLKTQEPDGYLGTYPTNKRWTSWDVWVHKYDLLGLLTYYQYAGEEGKKRRKGEEEKRRQGEASSLIPQPSTFKSKPSTVLATCRKIGDLLIATFGDGAGQRDINKSGEHVGMAPDSVLEAVVLLYRATDDARYKRFAEYIVHHYDAPGGPAILASLEKFGSVRKVANAKAYEMTSNFNGILELYRVTGDKRLLSDMRTAWKDIVANRLYITGSASSYEVYQDDFHLPNAQNANICETCVTVTWEQMNLELLRLTGEAQFADQLETSIYNHLLGAQKPTGDDWAYYTPLDGHKPYDTATTCCHSSGPRGIALIPEFATMTSNDGGLVVNVYNSGTATTHTHSGDVTLTQKTVYPLDGQVALTLNPARNGQKFPLRLRVPAWSSVESLRVNGRSIRLEPLARGAQYVTLNQAWKKNDKIELNLTVPTKLVLGDHENEGKAVITKGPLVLALDSALNAASLKKLELATDNPTNFKLLPTTETRSYPHPVYTVEGHIAGQKEVVNLLLSSYADVGGDGKSRYEVWIPLPGHAMVGGLSAFSGASMSASRTGNTFDSIADDDAGTFAVTYNSRKAEEDWFAVTTDKPVWVSRVTFMHGKTFHDGGWFDMSAGKPQIQVQTTPNGEWKTVATLNTYPATTATKSAGLKSGQPFTISFAPVQAVAVRIVGKPACGDNPAQSFASCAELQAFAPVSPK